MPSKQSKSTTSASKASKKQEQVEEQVEEEIEEVDGEEEEVEVEEADVEDDSGDKKKKKYEYVCESVDTGFEEIKRIDAEIKELMKYRDSVIKSTEKFAHKQLKQTKKRRSNENSAPREANGFVKPKIIPQKFKEFYEAHLKNSQGFSEIFATFDINVDVPRTEITKMVYHYIRTNSLYNKKADGSLDKRSIAPNSILKALFDIKKGDLIFDRIINEEDIREDKREDPKERERIGQKTGMTFSNFQTYMNRLYDSDDEDIELAVDDVNAEALEETEVVDEPLKVSKGKKTVVATK